MSKLTLTEWVDSLCSLHVSYFKNNPQGDLMQTCIVETDDESLVIACPWGDYDQRDIILDMLRDCLQRLQAHRYAFFAETWISSYRVDEDTTAKPSERSNRQEAVVTVAVERNGSQITRSQKIMRDKSGGVSSLISSCTNYESLGGELLELFGAPVKH